MASFGSPGEAGPRDVYEQEVRINVIFETLSDGFKKLDKLSDAKQAALLKEMTALMQEAKTLIRDFEREARADNMPVAELNYRKKQAVQELNGFIGLKKAYGAQAAARGELLAAGSSAAGGMTPEQMHATPTADLMEAGRRQIGETDASLVRAERLVNDTVAIGAQTAETLQLQGKQLEKVADDLDEIHFTMRKARQVLRDMARGLATDKCILFFLALIVVGVVVVVVLKATGVGGGGDDAASPSPSPPQAPAQG